VPDESTKTLNITTMSVGNSKTNRTAAFKYCTWDHSTQKVTAQMRWCHTETQLGYTWYLQKKNIVWQMLSWYVPLVSF